jgi:hypothetical protein
VESGWIYLFLNFIVISFPEIGSSILVNAGRKEIAHIIEGFET